MNDMPIEAIRRRPGAVGLIRPYAETLAMVAASTLAGMLIAPRWGNSAVDLLYLPAVLAAAGFYGLAPGVIAATASALAFNYYFTEPFRTLHVNSRKTLPPSSSCSWSRWSPASSPRECAPAPRPPSQRVAQRDHRRPRPPPAVDVQTTQQIGDVACRELGRLFDCNAVLMTGQTEPRVAAARPSQLVLTPADIAAAAWAMESGRPVGRGADAAATTEWVFYPVRSSSAVLAAIGLARDDGTRRSLFGTRTARQLDRPGCVGARTRSPRFRSARKFAAVRERDRTRSALLSTIGQDIGPHLSAMATAVAGLLRGGDGDKGLLGTIGSEAGKLQRYLANLLDLGPEADDKPIDLGEVSIDLFHRSSAAMANRCI
jgi:two-component system sensor histidine kinase KdpD